jgi:hypothetical protein
MKEGIEWTNKHPEVTTQDDDMGMGAGAGAGAGGAGPSAPRVPQAGGAKLDSTLWQHTSLKPYIEVLDGYLKELYASLRASGRERAQGGAGPIMGDW